MLSSMPAVRLARLVVVCVLGMSVSCANDDANGSESLGGSDAGVGGSTGGTGGTAPSGGSSGVGGRLASDSGSSDAIAYADCYPPKGPIAVVPECASTELCMPTDDHVVIDPEHCPLADCRFTYAENAGPTLTYDDGRTFMFFRFDGTISAATLLHANFYRTYPIDNGTFAMYAQMSMQAVDFDVFELGDDHVHVKLSFTITEASARIQSSHELCVDGDVLGSCRCVYGGFEVPGSVELDLPADIP